MFYSPFGMGKAAGRKAWSIWLTGNAGSPCNRDSQEQTHDRFHTFQAINEKGVQHVTLLIIPFCRKNLNKRIFYSLNTRYLRVSPMMKNAKWNGKYSYVVGDELEGWRYVSISRSWPLKFETGA